MWSGWPTGARMRTCSGQPEERCVLVCASGRVRLCDMSSCLVLCASFCVQMAIPMGSLAGIVWIFVRLSRRDEQREREYDNCGVCCRNNCPHLSFVAFFSTGLVCFECTRILCESNLLNAKCSTSSDFPLVAIFKRLTAQDITLDIPRLLRVTCSSSQGMLSCI